MNENRRPYMIPLRVAAVLLVLSLMTTSFVSGRYARYTTSDSGAASARIAAYVFDVRDNEGHMVTLTQIQNPGDDEDFSFSIANYRGNEGNKVVSEVAEDFVMNIKLLSSLPLTITMTGNGKTVVLSGVSGETGDEHSFAASVASDVTYTLTVDWPETENDIEYSRAGIAALFLTVNAQQAD